MQHLSVKKRFAYYLGLSSKICVIGNVWSASCQMIADQHDTVLDMIL